MISGYILGRMLGISNQIGELQGRCVCFSVPPLPFSLFLFPFLSFACLPLVESCWRRTSLIFVASCLCAAGVTVIRNIWPACGPESKCFVGKYMWAVCIWGGSAGEERLRAKWMGWEAWKLECWAGGYACLGREDFWSALLSFLLLPLYLWVFRNEAIMHVSQWPPHLVHPSVSGCTSPGLWMLLGKSKEITCPSGLLHCSSESVPGFVVSGCRKACPLTLKELQLYHCKLRQILLPVDEVAQPFWNIL